MREAATEFTTEARRARRARTKPSYVHRVLPAFGMHVFLVTIFTLPNAAQNRLPNSDQLKKANSRPVVEASTTKVEPFDGASVEKMTGKCVTLDTEHGTATSG